jgi:Uncharacterised nucleotidyltransferase
MQHRAEPENTNWGLLGYRPLDPEAFHWSARLLWEACRRDPDTALVREAVSNGADPDVSVRASITHRIGPLLWRALETAGSLDFLGRTRRWLSDIAELHRVEGLLLLPRAVSMALSPLTHVGLQPVVFKGAALADRYPEPGLRPMEDIDLLLPREQIAEAIQALVKEGWRVVRTALDDHYDTVLRHPDVPSVILELHHALESSHAKVTSLDPQALWDRRIPRRCLGSEAFVLPLPEELVVLATHAGKPFHSFGRLIWVADLAMVLGECNERGGRVDWSRVRSIAEAGRCSTLVASALSLAEHVGVQVPRGTFALPAHGWRAQVLRRLTDVGWPLGVTPAPPFHLRFALTDGWWRRTRLLFGSGHGMSVSNRVAWTATTPVEAVSRWRELQGSASK